LFFAVLGTACASEPPNSGNTTAVARELVVAPAHQALAWQPMGGPPGGKGYDIRFDPDLPTRMYVTDAHAGVFRSADAGNSWFASNAGLQREESGRVPAFSLTVDPHDSMRVWAGMEVTGQLFLSTNRGDTWTRRDLGVAQPGRAIRGITVDPNNPAVVFAAAEIYTGVAPTFQGWDGSSGAVFRNDNYGIGQWQVFWTGDALARYVVISPDDSREIYISTGIFDMDAANSTLTEPGGVGIARTLNGGRTWDLLDEAHGLAGRRVPSLAIDPSHPSTLLAAAIEPRHTARPLGAYVTHDRGDSWSPCLAHGYSPAGTIAATEEVHAVEIVAQAPHIWYAAGRPELGSQGVFWRSTNSGVTWSRHLIEVTGWETGTPFDIEVNPTDPDHIFINNYGGGNVVSLDGGVNWADASNGYSGAEAAAVAVEPGTRANVVASGNQGTFRSVNYAPFEGLQILPNEGLVASAIAFLPSGRSHSVLVGGGFGDVFRNDGVRWHRASHTPADVSPIPAFATMADFAFSQSEPDEIYTGFYHRGCQEAAASSEPDCVRPMPELLRSTDGGDHWSAVHGTPFAGDDIFDIEVTASPYRVWVATAGGLFSREPGVRGPWLPATSLSNIAMPGRNGDAPVVSAIAVDPNNPGTMLAGSSPGVMFRSVDGGVTWRPASAGLHPNEVVVDVVFDPTPLRASTAYVATSRGVRYSVNSGASWTNLNAGLSFTSVNRLAISDDGGVLYVATHGGGVFQLQAESVVPAGAAPRLVP